MLLHFLIDVGFVFSINEKKNRYNKKTSCSLSFATHDQQIHTQVLLSVLDFFMKEFKLLDVMIKLYRHIAFGILLVFETNLYMTR